MFILTYHRGVLNIPDVPSERAHEIIKDIENKLNEESHVNLFIFDKQLMTLERFEPNGITMRNPGEEFLHWYGVEELDKQMKILAANETLKRGNDVFEYKQPSDYWKGPGIQKRISLGYCFVIMFVWLDLRMSFPDMTPLRLSTIIDESLKIQRLDWITLCETYLFGLDKSITKHFLDRLRKRIDEKDNTIGNQDVEEGYEEKKVALPITPTLSEL